MFIYNNILTCHWDLWFQIATKCGSISEFASHIQHVKQTSFRICILQRQNISVFRQQIQDTQSFHFVHKHQHCPNTNIIFRTMVTMVVSKQRGINWITNGIHGKNNNHTHLHYKLCLYCLLYSYKTH